MEYFSIKEIKLLKQLAGKKYNKGNATSRAENESLKPLYAKVEHWAILLKNKLFPNGRINVNKKPTNQGQIFEYYQWAKIWPDQETFNYWYLAFTVAVTSDEKYELKFDIVKKHEVEKSILEKYEFLRGNSANSKIVKVIDYNTISNWDDLVTISENWIKNVIKIYDGFFSYIAQRDQSENLGIIASVGWNSSGWKKNPSVEDLKHAKSFGWVNETGMMGESLNFAIDDHIGDYYIGLSPNFNKMPTYRDKTKIVFLISSKPGGNRMLVGCYAFPEIGSFRRELFDEEVYEYGNIKALTANIVHFDQYLAINELDFLKEGQNLSKMSFTYLDRQSTLDLLFIVLKANPKVEKLRTIIQKIISTSTRTLNISMTKSMNNLNTIFYGPPGTGKTYSTVDHSLKIVAPLEYADILKQDLTAAEKRSKVKGLFNQYVSSGKIGFSTFHQSLGYEDFIEGIKPTIEEFGDNTLVSYRIEDGIFKQMAIKASYQMLITLKPPKSEIVNNEHNFDLKWDSLLMVLGTELLDKDYVELDTRLGKIRLVGITDKGNLELKHGEDGSRSYIVSYSRLKTLYKGIQTKRHLDQLSNINKSIRSIIGGCNATAYYATLDRLFAIDVENTSDNEMLTQELNYLEQKEVLEKGGYQFLLTNESVITQPNFVLIIDEINRGNVSQIFGELITNIESDKRLGREEAIGITLPYSKELFFVPNNLHIIGTMNTADRSIEALDVALRRRFEFKEITPKALLLENIAPINGINIKDFFVLLNKRIVILLGKDHEIGHAYFLQVNSIDTFKVVLANKIVPLLQEYFYNDYGKIGLVLGEGFITNLSSAHTDSNSVFAKFYDYESEDLNDSNSYQIKDISEMNDKDFIEAIKLMLVK
jgi:5-methylcytosine-specific restriction endonuclease McrBC GTP-binding regulatory subunit McrB